MKILIVEDEQSSRKALEMFLANEGNDVTVAEHGEHAVELLKEDKYDLILSDIQMPVMNGFELLEHVIDKEYGTPLICMTAYASIEDAIKAVKNGAEDYLPKPVNLDELVLKIKKLADKQKLNNENEILKRKIEILEFPEIIGKSKVIIEVKSMIAKVAADTYVPVLIYGKSGTGKELVARNIHKASNRNNKPFVAINCGALNPEILESELFGHVKGAFTGANSDRVGFFETADGGTLFLDEISEMSKSMQVKLLRALQDKKIIPVGSSTEKDIDVRIISASNVSLEELVRQGDFREDLYYRLNVIQITVPKLMHRREDIPLLVDHFVNEKLKDDKILGFTKDAMEKLQSYSFPGNIRELENLIYFLSVTKPGTEIQLSDLPEKVLLSNKDEIISSQHFHDFTDYNEALGKYCNNFDKQYITYYFKKNNWNISKTAEEIGLSRVSLHKKITKLNIKKCKED